MKASIDRDRCEGYGTCATICPSVFVQDEWGYATVIGDGVPTPEYEEDARFAALECPMNAIALEE